MSKTVEFYTIRNISNLHVGSGENNYGVVDNLVQRDLNTGLPTIHSSSLKGALREFLENSWGKDDDKIGTIFGTGSQQGKWQFLCADILSRPVRSGKVEYLNATSPGVLKTFIRKVEDLGKTAPEGIVTLSKQTVANGAPVVLDNSLRGAIIEEMDWVANNVLTGVSLDAQSKQLLGDRVVLLSDQDMKDVELPFIARNFLKDGQSQNLWYEEVVPYDSRFVFSLIRNAEHAGDFESAMKENVQIGANASVGYGICKIEKAI